jgi:hypothetical protein
LPEYTDANASRSRTRSATPSSNPTALSARAAGGSDDNAAPITAPQAPRIGAS